MIQRWKRKPRTGRHSLMVDGQRVTVFPGDIVECSKSAIGGCVHKYELLRTLGGTITTASIDVATIKKPDDKAAKLAKSILSKEENHIVLQEGSIVVEEPAKTLEIKSRGTGFYDIVNPDNPSKPLNSKALRKKAAETMLGEMINELNNQ